MINCDWRSSGCELTSSEGFLSDAFSRAAQLANAHPLVTAAFLTAAAYMTIGRAVRPKFRINVLDTAAAALTVYGCLFVSSSVTDFLAYQNRHRPETMGNAVWENRTFGIYNSAIGATADYVWEAAKSGFSAANSRLSHS